MTDKEELDAMRKEQENLLSSLDTPKEPDGKFFTLDTPETRKDQSSDPIKTPKAPPLPDPDVPAPSEKDAGAGDVEGPPSIEMPPPVVGPMPIPDAPRSSIAPSKEWEDIPGRVDLGDALPIDMPGVNSTIEGDIFREGEATLGAIQDYHKQLILLLRQMRGQISEARADIDTLIGWHHRNL